MTDYLVLVGHEDPLKVTIKCTACDWTAPAPLPMSIDEFVQFGKYMQKKHDREEPRCHPGRII